MRQEVGRRSDLEVTVDADFDQIWYLIADTGSWSGLMPHVHAVEVLDRRGDRSLIRVDARRGWLPVRFVCGVVAVQGEERGRSGVFHRWYVSAPWRGIAETWRVVETGDSTSVQVSIAARGPAARAAGRLFILPLARRTLSMVQLLGEAHREAHREPG